MLTPQHAWLMLLFCSFSMIATWYWQQRCRNAGWVDVVWSALMGIQALLYGGFVLFKSDNPKSLSMSTPSLLVLLALGLALLWSGRLAWYLFWRVRGEVEDGRYQALRQRWEPKPGLKFFGFFLAQALIAWLLGLSFYLLFNSLSLADNTATGVQSSLFFLGLGLGIGAIVGETISDRQLARHRHQYPGITCRSGLWRYSRHPNYFFEWLHWLSYPLMVSSVYWGQDGEVGWGLWIWLAPVIMLIFLYRITGIPYTEKQAVKSRGDDYRRYQQETSAFFPWWPKASSPNF
jgi:cyclopropane-fatty-acyl-phospholipid synthase